MPALKEPAAPDVESGRDYVEWLIRKIVAKCPRRAPGSCQERRAQRILCQELERQGGTAWWQSFRFSRSLYAVLALHCGLGVLASACFFLHPLLAAGLHGVAAISYVADSNRWGYLLRRLLPTCQSQNLAVTFAARGKVRRRIVITGHADAAPTGWLFRPWLARLSSPRRFPRALAFLRMPLLLATVGLALTAALDFDAWWQDASFPRRPGLFCGLSIYFAALCLFNLQILWHDEIVAGANDNLSGCAALPVLAQRLLPHQPDDVELVFVVTGCEEAGTGGALALARHARDNWPTDETLVIVLEVLANGRLRVLREGELWPKRVPAALLGAARAVADSEPRFGDLAIFQQPAGATDALPLLAAGYPAMALGCIDDNTGTPGHYHLPEDLPDRLNFTQLMSSIDFAEALVRRLMAKWRTGPVQFASHVPSRQSSVRGLV